MKSIVQQRGDVVFPQFLAERVYMREFYKDKPLPDDLSRWQPTVDAMLADVDTDGPIYLMVDQGVIRGGNTHRREGVHIDGYWNPGIAGHGHNGISAHGAGRPSQGHGGQRREHGYVPPPPPGHGGRGGGSHLAGVGGWANATYEEHEGILLASDVQAAMGYMGDFHGSPVDGGNCAHIDTTGLVAVPFEAGKVYAGNVTMLHESLPVAKTCNRTVVRLNIPNWTVH